MEGYLPAFWCIIWYVIMIPVVGYGIYQIKKITEEYPETKALVAVSGAFMFILSSLNITNRDSAQSLYTAARPAVGMGARCA